MPRRGLLIDGITPNELVNLDDLEAYALAGRPIVFSVGEAEIAGAYSRV